MRTQTQAQLAAMVEEYRSTRARMAGLSAQLGALTATARSADGSVTATVGPRGELCDLSIDAQVARRLDLKTLTSRILEASGLAAERARDEVGRAVAQALPSHLQPLVRPGGVDPGALLPEDMRTLLHRRAQERP
jgi:DNA-binding protein YbaB